MQHSGRFASAVFFVGSMQSLLTCQQNTFNVTEVMQQASMLASHSWEYGTAAEALLELHNPELSVFSQNPFPGNQLPRVDVEKTPALKFAKGKLRTGQLTLIDGDGKCHFNRPAKTFRP